MKDWRTIPYWEIIKQSWQLILKNRYLWWLGFFVALPGIFNYDYSFRPESRTDWESLFSQNNIGIGKFIDNQGGEFWIVLAIIAFLILIFFLVLSFIGRGGLIDLVFRIRKGQRGSFKDGLKKGRGHLMKLVAIGFSVTILTVLSIILIAIPIIILFAKEAYIFGIILLFCALAILIPLLFIAYFLKNYGYIYTVSSQLTFRSALENAYNLFMVNWKSSLMMTLFFIPLNIFFFLAAVVFAAGLAVVFLIIGIAVWFLAGKVGVVLVIGLAILFFLIGLAILK